MAVATAKCPNDECSFFKKTKQRYEWAIKKKTEKSRVRICPKCKKPFAV